MTRPTARARMALAIGQAWFSVCEQTAPPAAWTAEQRATFEAMAEAVLHAARAGDRSDVAVAQALCFGFWRDHERPWAWARLGPMRQTVFLSVARLVIDAAQAMAAADRQKAQAAAA
ncbi:MAG: hypothetical protein ACOY5Y_06895 [Pseudomonadota bacterium]